LAELEGSEDELYGEESDDQEEVDPEELKDQINDNLNSITPIVPLLPPISPTGALITAASSFSAANA